VGSEARHELPVDGLGWSLNTPPEFLDARLRREPLVGNRSGSLPCKYVGLERAELDGLPAPSIVSQASRSTLTPCVQ
jgi:hypothetical protein